MTTNTKPKNPAEPPVRNSTAQGTYDGKELTRTCLRPGAYDAYDKPSLLGNQRQPHKGGM
jgi:hypothetical protein